MGYLRGGGSLMRLGASWCYCVSVWKNSMKVKSDFIRIFSFKTGDGRKVSFWKDPWCGYFPPYISSVLFHVSCNEDALVSDLCGGLEYKL